MLVQALRLYVAELAEEGAGWFFGVADKQLGLAINAIHAEPAYRWTLQSLAERAWMSRSAFAQKCKEIIGSSPREYVTHWRMLLAVDRLKNSSDPVSVISPSLDYPKARSAPLSNVSWELRHGSIVARSSILSTV